ncbi:hypothetical protein SAMN05660297_01999 [Natronincola peptidivorans]|uniref:Uncharacterized protein n=1 Tax=Natronincola peptidivorans TaxID=426128 RepID=A0A1I0DDX0_9FIRM|nr:hypothetical protein SAMN05660297_01999 [Natronincola peptidivorans]
MGQIKHRESLTLLSLKTLDEIHLNMTYCIQVLTDILNLEITYALITNYFKSFFS